MKVPGAGGATPMLLLCMLQLLCGRRCCKPRTLQSSQAARGLRRHPSRILTSKSGRTGQQPGLGRQGNVG